MLETAFGGVCRRYGHEGARGWVGRSLVIFCIRHGLNFRRVGVGLGVRRNTSGSDKVERFIITIQL